MRVVFFGAFYVVWRHFAHVAVVRLRFGVAAVRTARFLDRLQDLRARGSDHVLEVEARLNELSDRRPLGVKTIFALADLVHIEVEDLLFDDLRIFALERVALVEDVVDTAAQSPNVNFLAEAALLKDEFGR